MITLDALAEKTNHYYKGNPSKNRAPLKKICEIEKGVLSVWWHYIVWGLCWEYSICLSIMFS